MRRVRREGTSIRLRQLKKRLIKLPKIAEITLVNSSHYAESSTSA